MKIRYRAPWIIAHQDGEHRVLRDGHIVVDGSLIVEVGHEVKVEVDQEVVLKDRMITPGFISMHAHLHESPCDKCAAAEDLDLRRFWQSRMYEVLTTRGAAMDDRARQAATDLSLLELIRTGTTTVMQLGEVSDYVADAVERVGIRAYIGDGYQSARWVPVAGRRLSYEWDEQGGLRGLERAIRFAERLKGRADDRLRAVMYPAQVDTCSEELLRASREAADELEIPISTHAAQSQLEFEEIVKRHGRTPVEWLADVGFLGPATTLGHVLFVGGSRHVNYRSDDLALLAETGTTVAYSPWVFARTGIIMDSYPGYRRAGINVALGTDTCTQSMLHAMRWAAVLGKVAERHSDAATAGQAFDSATIRAAQALGRPDLGRINAGAKADLLFWRTDSIFMTPLRDPIRNLVYYAEPEDLTDVLVDGAPVLRDGLPVHGDVAAAIAGVQAAADRLTQRWPQVHWAGKTLEEAIPSTYQEWTDV